MTISASQVAELREKTGCGMKDCKTALTECAGDMAKAIEYLRKKGLAAADTKGGRSTNAGRIFSYIHSNAQIGVMLELCCETDFVANTDKFQELGKSLCMHVCAMKPMVVSRDKFSAELIEKEKAIYREQSQEQLKGKPTEVAEKILNGKLEKFFKDFSLMEQSYIRDEQKSIEEVVKENIAYLKENISVKRFARFQLGES